MSGRPKVLLVGWDAADWKVISPLIDEGLMPHMARLIEHGVMGNLATLSPMLSPMLWTSIATGKRPYKHGIHGFAEPDPNTDGVRPITNLSRKTKAIWNILSQNAKKSIVVGWWPSHPVEPINGCMVSNHFQHATDPVGQAWPLLPGTLHPPELEEALAGLRIHPHELEGDMLRYFVPRAPEIDQMQDKRLQSVAKIVAQCSTVHAAATYLLDKTPNWDFSAIYYDAIDHFGHGFMKYHPPRLNWIDDNEFDLYQHVVRAGYIYHDMMLGALLHLAGPETTTILISDHGFHSDHLRPVSLPNEPAGPAAEHRQFGIFVASGPGIKQDELVFGASLLDIVPTILSLLEIPVGRDMDGRVLSTILSGVVHETNYVSSWDNIEGHDGRHPPDTLLNPIESQEVLQQFIALGYVDEPSDDKSIAVAETVRELQYNLARSFVDGRQLEEAAQQFSALWERWPTESRFGVHLLLVQIEQLDAPAARITMSRLRKQKQQAAVIASNERKELLERLQEEFPSKSQDESSGSGSDSIDWERVKMRDRRRAIRLLSQSGVDERTFAYLEGCLLQLEGRNDEALNVFRQAEGAQATNLPSLYLKMGDVCIAKRDWATAADYYRRVVEIDSLNAQGHFGLARVALHERDWHEAVREATAAAGQHFYYAPAHLIAGIAHWRLGNTRGALQAFQRAIEIQPGYSLAHRILASFYWKQHNNLIARDLHLRLAREARRRASST